MLLRVASVVAQIKLLELFITPLPLMDSSCCPSTSSPSGSVTCSICHTILRTLAVTSSTRLLLLLLFPLL